MARQLPKEISLISSEVLVLVKEILLLQDKIPDPLCHLLNASVSVFVIDN